MTAVVEERPSDVAETPTKAEKSKTALPPAKEEFASFDDLLNKPARTRDVTVTVGDRQLKVRLRAIGAVAYDQLMASCPPQGVEREQGMIFDRKTFAPKLIAACAVRPAMDFDQASRLYADPNWAGGEAGGLFSACVELCQAGLDVPFTGSG